MTTRAHVRTVVTEYGVAELFGQSIRERAAALISIAHPDFRDELLAAHEGRNPCRRARGPVVDPTEAMWRWACGPLAGTLGS